LAIRDQLSAKKEKYKRRLSEMTKSMRALVIGAALSGFVAGTTVAKAQDTTKDTTKTDKASKGKKEKHACKGQNSCKGKGGCKAGDNGCKGKNSCKGKGGCSTDPKHPAPKDAN
jgi:hypothetical protein